MLMSLNGIILRRESVKLLRITIGIFALFTIGLVTLLYCYHPSVPKTVSLSVFRMENMQPDNAFLVISGAGPNVSLEGKHISADFTAGDCEKTIPAGLTLLKCVGRGRNGSKDTFLVRADLPDQVPFTQWKRLRGQAVLIVKAEHHLLYNLLRTSAH